MKLNINNIFKYIHYNINILNFILEFSRPNRSFKTHTSVIIKQALLSKNIFFNPIVAINHKHVIFWKNRKIMLYEDYFLYKKYINQLISKTNYKKLNY